MVYHELKSFIELVNKASLAEEGIKKNATMIAN